MKNENTEFLEKLAETLLVTVGDLTPETNLSSLASWDSMGQVAVLSLIDEMMGPAIPPGSLQKCVTVGDIMRLIGS